MRLNFRHQVTIAAPAERVWQVLARDFAAIGRWASAIPESRALDDPPADGEATVAGRVCTSTVPGVPAVQERFTHYSEHDRRFTYVASSGLPAFVRRAENTWSVRELGPGAALAEARAELDLHPLVGLLLAPLLKLQLDRTGARVFEELRHYIEHGEPHPRKVRALRRQHRKSALPPGGTTAE